MLVSDEVLTCCSKLRWGQAQKPVHVALQQRQLIAPQSLVAAFTGCLRMAAQLVPEGCGCLQAANPRGRSAEILAVGS